MTARAEDRDAFDRLVAPFRSELHAHCYRMLGSVHDADDALQEALLGAWRGLAGFEGRSALRSWLYKIATNACLRLAAKRPQRLPATEYRGPSYAADDLDPMVSEPVWLEPYPDDPALRLEQREHVELAFIAALQHLPAMQRAVLIMREVLGFAADETAELLDITVAAANSSLQRAREIMARRGPAQSQQATLRDLGEARQRELVTAFVSAWERSDVKALLALLTPDARFSMPPIPNWFLGRAEVASFFENRIFATPWRLFPMRLSGQLAFACYQGPRFRLGAVNVVTLRGPAIAELTGFLDPANYTRLGLPTDDFSGLADSYPYDENVYRLMPLRRGPVPV